MKKWRFIFYAFIFVLLLCSGCSNQQLEEPSADSEILAKFPENVMVYEKTSSLPQFDDRVYSKKYEGTGLYATINTIFKNCKIDLFSDEYKKAAEILNEIDWTKLDTQNTNDVNSKTSIRLNDRIYFPDDTAIIDEISGGDENYQMPQGTYEEVRSYLESVFEKRRGEALDITGCFTKIFSNDFRLHWKMFYDPPSPTGNDTLGDGYVYVDEFACHGTTAIAKELKSAFGDITLWESMTLEENAYFFDATNSELSIYGIDCGYCILPAENQGTYIIVNNYAIFYTPENVYKNVMDVVKEHKKEWCIIPNEE